MIRFITFEGLDGTGKTTQLNALESYFRARGRSYVRTREPGGTALGSLMRRVLLEVAQQPVAMPAELFLYLADRAQHVDEVILPALAADKIVICDRYTDSTLAYQGYGRGIDLKLLRELNAFAARGIQPDLTLLLDCPVELALSRTARRDSQMASGECREDRFEREQVEFHKRVRAGFLEIARAEPGRFRVIDAARSAGEVTEAILTVAEHESI